jgi:hypothetical protein
LCAGTDSSQEEYTQRNSMLHGTDSVMGTVVI